MYWHQGWEDSPPLVKQCAESWIRHHGDDQWSVHLLDKNNVHSWLKQCPEEDAAALRRFLVRFESGENVGGLAHYADLLRLVLLDHFGGVWTDATILCFQSLSAWLPPAITMGMPRSLSAERRTETWFIDNRCKDPVLSLWKVRYRDLYFSPDNQITYLDDWSTKRYQVEYWMVNVAMRSPGLAARVWNSPLALKHLKIRPYFATNAVLEYVLRIQIPAERMARLHQIILPIDCELMWDIHVSDWRSPMSDYQLSRFPTTPLLKLNHKTKWAGQIEEAAAIQDSAWSTWLKRAKS